MSLQLTGLHNWYTLSDTSGTQFVIGQQATSLLTRTQVEELISWGGTPDLLQEIKCDHPTIMLVRRLI